MPSLGNEKHCVFDLILVIIKPVFRVFFTFNDFIDIFGKMTAQTIGYLRVSTADQDVEKKQGGYFDTGQPP
jgi:hypothetical protein